MNTTDLKAFLSRPLATEELQSPCGRYHAVLWEEADFEADRYRHELELTAYGERRRFADVTRAAFGAGKLCLIREHAGVKPSFELSLFDLTQRSEEKLLSSDGSIRDLYAEANRLFLLVESHERGTEEKAYTRYTALPLWESEYGLGRKVFAVEMNEGTVSLLETEAFQAPSKMNSTELAEHFWLELNPLADKVLCILDDCDCAAEATAPAISYGANRCHCFSGELDRAIFARKMTLVWGSSQKPEVWLNYLEEKGLKHLPRVILSQQAKARPALELALADQQCEALILDSTASNPISQALIGASADIEGIKTALADPKASWGKSAMQLAEKITCPVLLIHGDKNREVFFGESIALFTALQLLNGKSRCLLLRGEADELARSPRPKQRLLRLTEILRLIDADAGTESKQGGAKA